MTSFSLGMTCSCCGSECPSMKQWHNRDTGYSICKGCIVWLKERNTSEEQIKEEYGVSGIHYEE